MFWSKTFIKRKKLTQKLAKILCVVFLGYFSSIRNNKVYKKLIKKIFVEKRQVFELEYSFPINQKIPGLYSEILELKWFLKRGLRLCDFVHVLSSRVLLLKVHCKKYTISLQNKKINQ